jgi:hypothetical protein
VSTILWSQLSKIPYIVFNAQRKAFWSLTSAVRFVSRNTMEAQGFIDFFSDTKKLASAEKALLWMGGS